MCAPFITVSRTELFTYPLQTAFLMSRTVSGTYGTEYLETLVAKSTEVVWGEIESFTERGSRSKEGTEQDIDVIFCATGLHMYFVLRWPIIGKDGINLQKEWVRDAACYQPTIANDTPNYSVRLRPGSPVGHGSVLPRSSASLFVFEIQLENSRPKATSSFLLKSGKAKAWQSHMFAWLDKTVWGGNYQSSFKDRYKENYMLSILDQGCITSNCFGFIDTGILSGKADPRKKIWTLLG